MSTRLNPYLNFRDNAREAMEFYRSVFGGDLSTSTFGEYGMSDDPTEQDKLMHSQLEAPSGMVLMGADTPNSTEYHEGALGSISISGEDEAEVRRYWDGLVAGGTVTVPFELAPWGDVFGMCVDKYGVSWLVNATPGNGGTPA